MNFNLSSWHFLSLIACTLIMMLLVFKKQCKLSKKKLFSSLCSIPWKIHPANQRLSIVRNLFKGTEQGRPQAAGRRRQEDKFRLHEKDCRSREEWTCSERPQLRFLLPLLQSL